MTADLRSQREVPLVPDGEFRFTAQDLRKIAALVHGEAGIVITESKAGLVYSRLAKRLRMIGLRSFREYCELVESEDGASERSAMIAAMTTNVTRFFREAHHFDHLRDVCLKLAPAVRAGKPLRIWSAACSSGEEPYSIAMTLLSAIPDASEHDVRILATDIDPNMVARGRGRTYPASVVASIPADMFSKWTARRDDSVVMSDALAALIRFNELNLLSDWPMRGKFDVIFCRNVMIYFDEPTQDRIWTRFANILTPEGMLYIGHSERIALDRHPFDLVGQTAYRLKRGRG
jgi:chemotaxis protein methyltransferase CheR